MGDSILLKISKFGDNMNPYKKKAVKHMHTGNIGA